MPTISKENYIKTVYQLNYESEASVTTSQIAQTLEITNAATSEMAKKLSENGLLNYEKYRGVELTDNGKQMALNIIRRHRLWELFLIEVLGLTWGEVHNEAELLEHTTSEFLIDKIDTFLNYPKFDPHGYPIPDKDGKLPEYSCGIPLSLTKENISYKVLRVDDKQPGFIEYISKLGISLNCEIKMLEKLSFDNSVMIDINGSSHLISEKASEKIFVEKLK